MQHGASRLAIAIYIYFSAGCTLQLSRRRIAVPGIKDPGQALPPKFGR